MASTRFRAAAALVVLGLLVAPALVAAPAAALGPLLEVTASPPRAVGTPSVGSEAEVNYTGEVNLLTDPIGRATIAVTITSQLGWSVAPSSFQWPVTSAGKFPFNFTVGVPPSAAAQTTDSLLIEARYRIGTSTVATQQTTVYAEAGSWYDGAAARITPLEIMAPGKTYAVEFDIRNTGNAGAVFTFKWADPGLNSRLKADFVMPQSPSIAGFNNTTATFYITPQATTPAGRYSIPVRVDITDRSTRLFKSFNFTLEVEFDNLPIFQGIFPRFDLQGPYTAVSFALLFLTIWFGLQVLGALISMRRAGAARRPTFSNALSAKVRRSGLVRLLGRVFQGRAPRRRASAPPLRPEELRARQAARAAREKR